MVFVAFGAGYLLGSVPFAWLFGRLAGADIRRTGSGNVGTANVEPVAGYPAAVVVFFLDVGKALLAVLIGSRWGPAGQVAAGDRLRLTPSGIEVRVRGLHAQNLPASTGQAGQRLALNLAGVERKDVRISWSCWGKLASGTGL